MNNKFEFIITEAPNQSIEKCSGIPYTDLAENIDIWIEKLRLKSGDILFCSPDRDMTQAELNTLADIIHQDNQERSQAEQYSVIVLNHGMKLSKLSDHQLTDMGLQRIPKIIKR